MIKYLILNDILLRGLASIWNANKNVHAQTFPQKPLRMVTSKPGGSNDFGALVKSEMTRLGKVIRDAGLR